ncbi:glucuronate isomerase [Oscillospiraceae bacterium PP1C4]
MKTFMDENFLLDTETAKSLYHDYAERMPILDYHCHINPAEIAQNRKFDNITQAWLGGDHYKWRLMRTNGVDEKYITGNGTDREKFQKFAEALPKAIGNPVYHWTHLELKRYFDCDLPISGETAEEIWNLCNQKLQEDSLSVRGIIERSNVTTIATTDDPVDSLEWHQKLKDDPTCKISVHPAWRPDKIMYIERDEFVPYLKTLEAVSGVTINSMASVYSALKKRLDHFDSMGCSASDHGVNAVVYAPADEDTLNKILEKRMEGKTLSNAETDAFKYALLIFLGKEYQKLNWVMQIHYGALRNTNGIGFKALGADTGFDAINNDNGMQGLAAFLDELNVQNSLPKTIIFSLNPNDNAAINTITGCFQAAGTPGKVQQGAAWWFNDTKTGMIDQMTSFANLSLLGNFIGMLTDSRSFLSYTRHEYFRRILCNLLGTWVENGEYPADMKALGKMVEDISYNNAMQFFGY